MQRALILLLLGALSACVVTQHEVVVGSSEPTPVPTPVPRQTTRDISLCLSGGGYRAVLFHVGVLEALNEHGLLPRIRRVTGVSGGAIVGAVLGLAWNELQFDAEGRAVDLDERVTQPLDALTAETLDVGAVLSTFTASGSSRRVARDYAELLYGEARLADLPEGADAPEFVFLATELVTGLNWEFARRRMGGPRLGYVPAPDMRIADAVAASSAIPGVLRPTRITFAAEQKVLPDPSPQEVDAWTLAALRSMGRDELAAQIESDGMNAPDLAVLTDEIHDFENVAFAGKVDGDVYLIDGGLVNNMASDYCETHGLDLISNASLRWVGEVEPKPDGLMSSMARTVVAMRRYAEAHQVEQIYRRRIVGRRFAPPCDAAWRCAPGSVGFVEFSPRERAGEIPDELRVTARLSGLSPEERGALIAWGRERAAATLAELQNPTPRFEDSVKR